MFYKDMKTLPNTNTFIRNNAIHSVFYEDAKYIYADINPYYKNRLFNKETEIFMVI